MKKKLIGLLAGVSVCAGLLTGCKAGTSSTKMPDYSEYITLGQYKGIEYEPMSVEVTEEELKEQVDYFLNMMGETTLLTEGTVKDGDTINLDYIGYADGEAFEGGTTNGNGTELTIGSHYYIDDFEEQLIGHEVGEEGIEVNVTFPDDYKNKDNTPNEMAGKDATFVCKINGIYQTTNPEELTDELVASNTTYDTVNSFMDALRMDYETYKKEQAEAQKQVDIITAAIENATINSYPEEEVQKLLDLTIQGAKDTAEAQNMEYETYLSNLKDKNNNPYTVESYEAEAKEYIQKVLCEKMVICVIADTEGITVSKQEVDDYVKAESTRTSGIDADTIYENYSMEDLAYAVLYDKVMEFLIENAIAIQKKIVYNSVCQC